MINFYSMKNILLCVIGVTPQIITETIYALHKKSPPVNIDEIFVITTSKGAQTIKETILEKGVINQLTKDYGMPPIAFTEENIILIKSEKEALADIRSTTDNELTGDLITETVRNLAQDENTTLHCSIAGGRKTMGYYLGSALQLYGRPQDKLYHVLVSEEFESNPYFFYPPAEPKTLRIKRKDGSDIELSTEKAKIELAELPFIRLRDFVDFNNKSFRSLVSFTQKEIDSSLKIPPLTVNLKENKLIIDENEIRLTEKMFSTYCFFAYLKKNKCRDTTKVNCRDCYDCFLPMKSNKDKNCLLETFKRDEQYLRSLISKINSTIKTHLRDEKLIPYYIIHGKRKYGETAYGLMIDRAKIIIKKE